MNKNSSKARRFIFFTKTFWNEPPRLRHQLARLLLEAGNKVIFFEKPGFKWNRTEVASTGTDGLILSRHSELIHHKLRLAPSLHAINAHAVTRSIAKAIGRFGIDDRDTVVNFNYEYYFLRKIFQMNRIVTVINDDFVSRALGGYTSPARWALERTCIASDRVLAVSVPLQKQLDAFCQAELFLPWADREYVDPGSARERTNLLFWGYINDRIDFDAVRRMARLLLRRRPEVRLMFVGPADVSGRAGLDKIRSLPNVDISGSSSLDELPLQRVLAGFIPYRDGVPSIEASTLPNKALQILARGLPLMVAGMPHFPEEPFVVRMGTNDFVEQVDSVRRRFSAVQPAICSFVAANGRHARLKQFLDPDCGLR